MDDASCMHLGTMQWRIRGGGGGGGIQGYKGIRPFARMFFKLDFVTLKLVFKLFMLILAILDYNNTLVCTFNTIPRFNYAAANHCQCHL